MCKLLLLPTSKLIPSELRVEFGDIPSAMIPLGSKPAIHYIAEPYVAKGFEVVAAVYEGAEFISSYLDRHFELNARLVDVGQTFNLGETICRVLDLLAIENRQPELLVINFADTFVGDELEGKNVICYQELEDVFRWTTFSIDSEESIVNIAEKGEEKANNALPVFVGVFSIEGVSTFHNKLKNELSNYDGGVDPFYRAILSYFNGLSKSEKNFKKVTNWFDFGHLDTYYATKRTFFLNKRCFNDVVVDNVRGMLTKRSSKTHKFINEVKWYMKLPKGLQHIAPRVFDFSLDPDSPYVELEFYGYPALNDLFLFSNFDMGFWKQVMQAIANVSSEMMNYRYEPENKEELKQSMQDMYVNKTLVRIGEMKSDYRFAEFFCDELIINGDKCVGVTQCVDLIPSLLKDLKVYDIDFFSIIHGDLCLSNILYDRKNGFIRVIDPRGEFGMFDMYGDYRYDLAKLSHSYEGGYDFIVNGLFDLEVAGNYINFHIHKNSVHEKITKLFTSWLQKHYGEYYLQVKLIESLLFLSMVPLHSDKFQSQRGFLAQGLWTFTKVLKDSQIDPGVLRGQ